MRRWPSPRQRRVHWIRCRQCATWYDGDRFTDCAHCGTTSTADGVQAADSTAPPAADPAAEAEAARDGRFAFWSVALGIPFALAGLILLGAVNENLRLFCLGLGVCLGVIASVGMLAVYLEGRPNPAPPRRIPVAAGQRNVPNPMGTVKIIGGLCLMMVAASLILGMGIVALMYFACVQIIQSKGH